MAAPTRGDHADGPTGDRSLRDDTCMPWHSSEARLRAVVETAVDGVILIDRRGLVLLFNPACERLFGYRADEVIGQNVKMLMPNPYRDEHDHYIANYLRTGQAKIIGIGREVEGRRKDGTVFPMDLSVSETFEDDDPVFVGIVHDLSERHQAARALAESAERLRAVVDTAVDGVILIDRAGAVLMFNPACERLFGYKSTEMTGQNVRLLMPEPYRAEHDGYLTNYLQTGTAKIIGVGREVTGQRKDGSTFPLELSVGEAKHGGQSIFVGVIHDLTERKRTEEQLVQAQKMEAVGQLAGGIAHDFNNLLTVIAGNAELLQESLAERPDLMELAVGILNAGDRGAELTQRLLAFSRRQVLKPSEIDCNQLIETLRPLLRRTLHEDVDIRTTLDPSIWPTFADRAQLESAILNLAINAQDAMPDGGVLSVTTTNMSLDDEYQEHYPEVRPGQYVMISVSDTGVGMAPEVLAHAFEPFFTTKEIGKGSGLGLSMIYGFVKQSNGHVTIYSAPSLGTTVRIYLPAGLSLDEMEVESDPGQELVMAATGRLILIVEDDPFVRAYAAQSISSLGFTVIVAVDGNDALQKLARGPVPDLLFTDIVMPGGMTGWELADHARDMHPNLRVLYTSGYALETLAERGRLPPGATVIDKPYRKATIARQLRDIFRS